MLIHPPYFKGWWEGALYLIRLCQAFLCSADSMSLVIVGDLTTCVLLDFNYGYY